MIVFYPFFSKNKIYNRDSLGVSEPCNFTDNFNQTNYVCPLV